MCGPIGWCSELGWATGRPYGTKRPGSYISLINDGSAMEFLDKFVVVFIDDILVYSKNEEEQIGRAHV